MDTRRLLALTVTLAGGCSHAGGAAHPRPAPGTAPMMDEQAVTRPDSFCPYVSADGPSLVCIDISSMGRIGAVVFDVGARSRRAIPLIDVEGYDPCGGDEGVRSVRQEGFAALNRELASRLYRPTAAVLTYAPPEDSDSPFTPPPPYVEGAATVALANDGDDRSLTLTSGGQVLESLRLRWYPADVIAVDDRHVGVVSHHRIQIWDLGAAAPSCAGSPGCPSHYPVTRGYLGAICDDAFGDQNESYPSDLSQDQAAGELAQDDFAILAAAYRALAGEAFTDPGLRDFFYGKGASGWLPAACFGRFASLRSLPEDRSWERDMIERGAHGKSVDGD